MDRKLRDLLNLPYVYNTENSQEVEEELLKLQINEKYVVNHLRYKGYVCKFTDNRNHADY